MFSDRKDMYVPSFLVQLRFPSWRLPLYLQDLFWRKDKVVDWLKTRVPQFATVANRSRSSSKSVRSEDITHLLHVTLLPADPNDIPSSLNDHEPLKRKAFYFL